MIAGGFPLRQKRQHEETALNGVGAAGVRQEDPREKRGIVGLFCRVYDVREAIAAYLPHLFTEAGHGRYTYTGATTHGGGWVLEGGRFFYSFHSTDPHSGKLLNSWDLVRLHLYGYADEGKEPGTRTDRLPSMKLMEEKAMSDVKVKGQLLRERAGDFDFLEAETALEGDSGGADPQPHGAEHRTKDEGGDSTGTASERRPPCSDGTERRRSAVLRVPTASTLWKETLAGLDFDKKGRLMGQSETVRQILRTHPETRGRMRYNEFTGDVDVFGELPWKRSDKNRRTWTNNDDSELRVWFSRKFGFTGPNYIYDGWRSAALENMYHPVREYLGGLKWDGERRVEKIFTEVLGAEDTELNRELAKLFCKGAVGRIMKPGCKFDYMIVLYGPEGCGKSSLFSLLAGEEWFSDSVSSIEGKQGMEDVQGKWILELAELTAWKKSQTEVTKNFISRQVDKYRPAFGRTSEAHPRECVLVGTTNEELFLKGIETGNRRHPVVVVRPELRSVRESVREWVSAHRDQVWAEAVEMWKGDPTLWLSAELTAAVAEVQKSHNLDMQNPLFPEVDRFLYRALPVNWELFDTEARRKWLEQNPEYDEETPGFAVRRYVTVPEVMQECLGMEKGKNPKEYNSLSREIGRHLNTMEGWKKMGSKRNKLYGVQMTWERLGGDSEDALDDL